MKAIQWGFLTIYPYGLCVAGGVLVCMIWMLIRERHGAFVRGTASWFAVLGIPLAVSGARLLFFLSSLDRFLDRGMGEALNLTGGGYLFYGAFGGLALAGWITGKRTRQPAGTVLDAAAAPAALMIAAARMGESLVRMGAQQNIQIGYGRNILDWFDAYTGQAFVTWDDPSPLFRYPFAIQDYYGEWNFGIFFLEAVAALVIFLILICWKNRLPGTRAMAFLSLYACCQAVLESMRSDAVARLGFIKFGQLSLGFVKVNQLMALPVLLLVVSIALHRIRRRTPWLFVLGYGSILLGCGVIAAMEFALEEKIRILLWMRMDLCYLVMALAAIGMIIAVCSIIRRSDKEGGEAVIPET